MAYEIKLVPTEPFDDQKPGTSGLRKTVKTFQLPHYVENFVQSYFLALGDDLKGASLFVGGDGRYFMKQVIDKIVQMAAANGVERLIIARQGICSTPAASCIIRQRNLSGGIILTASHNPGGPNADFGMKFNGFNGGPAPEKMTNRIFQISKEIKDFKLCPELQVDISNFGTFIYEISDGSKFTVEIIDGITLYHKLMSAIFDFDSIRRLLNSGFRITVNALHGVMGPYVRKIFVQDLGMNPEDAVNCDNLEDFGGLHPDPNLTYGVSLVNKMKEGIHDFGVAFDGDGDRNMILGRNAFFVTPCDSLAILAANIDCVPFYKEHRINGVARSMPTSAAVDRVAASKGYACYETPTGWKFFGNLMDDNRITICGEESFGTGSNHIREKDGMWAALAWLSVLAVQQKSVEDIVRNHWLTYGRNFYTRYDYENCDAESARAMMEHLETLCTLGSLKDKTFSKGNRSYTVKLMDNFSYLDPVDGSKTDKQGIRIIFVDGSRIVYRLSGTGSTGATIRMYVESYESEPNSFRLPPSEVLKSLIDTALEISQLSCFTGRDEPTVIT